MFVEPFWIVYDIIKNNNIICRYTLHNNKWLSVLVEKIYIDLFSTYCLFVSTIHYKSI